MAPDIHFLSFGSSRMAGSRLRIRRDATKMGVFASINILSEKDLDAEFWRQRGEVVRKYRRGYGLWTWKAYLLMQFLHRAPLGDFLVYADVGCALNPEGVDKLLGYFAQIAGRPLPWASFEIEHRLGPWTKRTLLAQYGADDPEFRQRRMLAAAIHFVQVTAATRAFAREWHEAMGATSLIDDSPAAHEHSDFIENRHDQSVFTLLGIQKGVLALPDESYWEPHWNAHLDCPIHGRRWKHRLPWPSAWMRHPCLARLLRRL
jgi:hypothetical protein